MGGLEDKEDEGIEDSELSTLSSPVRSELKIPNLSMSPRTLAALLGGGQLRPGGSLENKERCLSFFDSPYLRLWVLYRKIWFRGKTSVDSLFHSLLIL